ncbi:XRE family transcriptional regulator [Latilactobacillus sakei]|nr:helix-turn-helix transcriptional regulator [Latilactobacillus sakei]AUX11205.1 XRE family transcriptional regulator [Latilactobacillus sakei]
MIKQIGNLIRTKRLDQKMTIEQLAEKAELSASFIAKFERNDQNNISIQALEKIVNALNMKLGDLFMYEGISDTTTLELIGYLSRLSETDQQELSAAILKMIKISQKNSK